MGLWEVPGSIPRADKKEKRKKIKKKKKNHTRLAKYWVLWRFFFFKKKNFNEASICPGAVLSYVPSVVDRGCKICSCSVYVLRQIYFI